MAVASAASSLSWKEREEQAIVLFELARQQRAVQERLARFREEMAPPGRERLTQEEASERAGVPVRQWQRWEKGETVPHLKNLERLAERLGIPLDDFRDATEPLNGTAPTGGRSQLDRIEAKLDRLLDLEARVVELERAMAEDALEDEADEPIPAPEPHAQPGAGAS